MKLLFSSPPKHFRAVQLKWLPLNLACVAWFAIGLAVLLGSLPTETVAQETKAKAKEQTGQLSVDLLLCQLRQDKLLGPLTLEQYDAYLERMKQVDEVQLDRLVEVAQDANLRSIEISLAIDTLGWRQYPKGLPVLLDLLYNEESNSFRYRRNSLHQAIANHGESVIPQLNQIIESNYKVASRNALEALMLIESPKSIALVRRRLQISLDQAPADLSIIPTIRFLTKHQDRATEALLFQLIKSELDRLPPTQLLEEQPEPASDDDRQVERPTYNPVCSAAIDAMGQIGRRETCSALLMKLLNRDLSPYQKATITSLGELQEPAAIPALVRFLADPPEEPIDFGGPNACAPGPPAPTRRELAIAALVKIGPPAKPQIMQAAQVNDRTGHGALSVLAAWGTPDAKALFEKLLVDRKLDKSLRAIAVNGLTEIANPTSLRFLIDALREEPPLQLTPLLVKAISSFDQSAREPMLQLLASPDSRLAGSALSVLCLIDDPRDWEAIAAFASQKKNDGLVAIKSFLDLARAHPSSILDEALWKMATFEIYGSDALKVLATRDQVDRDRLQQQVIQSLRQAKHLWQVERLVNLLKPVDSPEVTDLFTTQVAKAEPALASRWLKLLINTDLPAAPGLINTRPELIEPFFEALKQHPDPQQLEGWFVSAMDDPALARQAIVKAGELKLTGTSDKILQVVQDPSKSWLHPIGINALALLGDQRLIQHLLEQPRSDVATNAGAIVLFGDQTTRWFAQSYADQPALAVSVMSAVRDPKAIPVMQEMLANPAYEPFHFTLVRTLAEMGDVRAIELLTTEFKHPKRYAPSFVWESLNQCPRRPTMRQVKPLLRSPDSELQAIHYFLRLGTRSALAILEQHLPQASENGAKLIRSAMQTRGRIPIAKPPPAEVNH